MSKAARKNEWDWRKLHEINVSPSLPQPQTPQQILEYCVKAKHHTG